MLADLFQYLPPKAEKTGSIHDIVKVYEMPAFVMENDQLTITSGRMFHNGEVNAHSTQEVTNRIRALMELFRIGALYIAPTGSCSLFQHWARAERTKNLSLATSLLATEHMQLGRLPTVRVSDQTTKVTLADGVESNHGLLSELAYVHDDKKVVDEHRLFEFFKKELEINLCAYDRTLVGMLRGAAPEGSETTNVLYRADSELRSWGFPSGAALLSHKKTNSLLKGDEAASFPFLDPVVKLEILLLGIVGSYQGIRIYTDAMRPMEYRVLNDSDNFVVAAPNSLGKLYTHNVLETSINDGKNVITRHQTYSAYVFDKAVVRVA